VIRTSVDGATRVGISTDATPEYPVVHVDTLAAFIQVVGHATFNRASRSRRLYRGQTRLHWASGLPTFVPSAYRGVESVSGREQALSRIRRYVEDLTGGAECDCPGPNPRCWSARWPCTTVYDSSSRGRSALVSGTPRAAVEPLLQQYGLGTTWLDLVDNAWVALWFACHEQHSKGHFAHHVKRSATDNAFAFVAVFDVGEQAATRFGGVSTSADSGTRLVDLRQSAPSVYLRPHAQHGLMVSSTTQSPDLARLLVGIIRISLRDALDWLGESQFLSPHGFFPPSSVDEGYRRLLEYAKPPSQLGKFTVFGPGY
jgi:hypothetical protein